MLAETEESGNGPPPKLVTEGPLTEKDQQGQATERQRKLAEIALEKWRRLKEKMVKPFKK